jgi:hypothetical protein
MDTPQVDNTKIIRIVNTSLHLQDTNMTTH